MGELPPCEEVSIDLGQRSYLYQQDWVSQGAGGPANVRGVLAGKAQLAATEQLTFTDADGNKWLLIPEFGLEPWAGANVLPSVTDPLGHIRFTGTFSPATGCS